MNCPIRFLAILALWMSFSAFGQENQPAKKLPDRPAVDQTQSEAKQEGPGQITVAEKIHPTLRSLISSAAYVPVFIVLKQQPQREIFQRHKGFNSFRSEAALRRVLRLQENPFGSP